MTAACATMKELWLQRNAKLFEEKKPTLNRFKSIILQIVYEGGYRMDGVSWKHTYDSRYYNFLKLVLNLVLLISLC